MVGLGGHSRQPSTSSSALELLAGGIRGRKGIAPIESRYPVSPFVVGFRSISKQGDPRSGIAFSGRVLMNRIERDVWMKAVPWLVLLVTGSVAAGTASLVKNINTLFPLVRDSSPYEFTRVGNSVYFRASDELHGDELWKTDGTAPGTELVKDINPGRRGSSPSPLVNLDGTLLFTAYEPSVGYELWRSDGTAAGTSLFKDINPGPDESNPYEFVVINHVLYFTASDGVHGYELWKSDGTAAGTVMVKQT